MNGWFQLALGRSRTKFFRVDGIEVGTAGPAERSRHALAKLLGALFLLTLCCAVKDSDRQAADAATQSKYQIEAVFIYNFAKFVEWPASAFADANSPIVIGVLGENPFGSFLEQAVKGNMANDKKITIKRFDKVQEIGACHILFISSSESSHLSKTLDSIEKWSVLSVSNIDRFARRGGVIGFTLDNDKVSFDINVDAAKRAKLKVSSKLLNLARVVTD